MPQPRVIVTRPAREAAHWVEQLGTHGIDAVALPLIAIGPCTDPATLHALAQAHARLADYRALMFVSGNAATHFFESNQALALDSKALTAIKNMISMKRSSSKLVTYLISISSTHRKNSP